MNFLGSCQSVWGKVTELNVSLASDTVLFGDDGVVDTLSGKSMTGTVYQFGWLTR